MSNFAQGIENHVKTLLINEGINIDDHKGAIAFLRTQDCAAVLLHSYSLLSEARAALHKDHAAYVRSQFERIKQPRLNHVAGVLKIKGDVGGETRWINVSADQLEAISNILQSMPSNN
jgi:hypothetical protein